MPANIFFMHLLQTYHPNKSNSLAKPISFGVAGTQKMSGTFLKDAMFLIAKLLI